MTSITRPNQIGAFEQDVERGDIAREAQAWDVAARHYRNAVTQKPQAAWIWLQLGHALKEQGDLDAAEAAYQTALQRQPDDGEASLQLGFLHILRGDPDQAVPHFRRAQALGISNEHMLDVLTRAGADFDLAPLAEGAAIPVIYLDVSDLVAYFQEKRYPTGIQRMEIEMVKASRSWLGAVPLRICSFVDEVAFWVDVDPASLATLCDLAAVSGTAQDPDWRAAVAAFGHRLARRPACDMPPGAALINLGPQWSVDYMAALREAKARCNLRYVPFIHDLIPIIVPEYLPPFSAGVFSAWFGSVLMHADAIVTNSECTRRDVMRVGERVRLPNAPPVVTRLDAQMGRHRAVVASERRLVLERLGLANRSFVLFVSTLEARKNHLIAFRTWARLLDRHPAASVLPQKFASELLGSAGHENERVSRSTRFQCDELQNRDNSVPLLVCVGHRGWQFDQAEMFLQTHQALRRHVVMLSGISDVELQVLYEACAFTVYSSFYEGWGLPVTESLCYGKICLAADHSSLPEAGGVFAEYYEEDSAKSMTGKAETLIFDPAYREERERVLVDNFRPRTWNQVLAGMVDDLLPQLHGLPAAQSGIAPVALGTVYEIGQPASATMPDRRRAIGEMLRADQAWHGVEAWGVFSKRAHARLVFQPDIAAQARPVTSDILVYVKLRASAESVQVTVQADAGPALRLSLAPHEQRIVQTRLSPAAFMRHIEQAMPIGLHLRADHLTDLRRHTPDDVRQIGIGVELFAICLETDVSTRVAMLERCSLHVPALAPERA